MADEDLWFRVKAGLPSSDEARILERRLGVERAWSFAHSMWDYFVRKHPGGELVGPEAAYLLASGSGWTGDPDQFCAAMIAAGFLAVIPEGFRVKGWKDWAGYHLTVRAKGKVRQDRFRASRNGDVTVTSQVQAPENMPSEGVCNGDPSPISVSTSLASQGGAGGSVRRARLVSPFASGQDPHPQTSAVLAALFDRGLDAAPPSERQAARVEAAIAAAGIPVAVERLVAAYAKPGAQKPLTYHVDAIRGEARKPRTHGDLGSEIHPWPLRLTEDEARAYREERIALAPSLADAPIGIEGPERELVDLNAKWRAIAEERA